MRVSSVNFLIDLPNPTECPKQRIDLSPIRVYHWGIYVNGGELYRVLDSDSSIPFRTRFLTPNIRKSNGTRNRRVIINQA